MSHPNWCGGICSECAIPCLTDQAIPCSPDCPGLNNIRGEPDGEECKGCEAIAGYSNKKMAIYSK